MQGKFDVRYLAGLIDGEGCIRVDGKTFCKLSLTISNTHKPLIEALFTSFGGSVREYADRRVYRGKRLRKVVYHWILRGRQAEQLLRGCYPHLIVKRNQAEIVFSLRANLSTIFCEVPKSELSRRFGLSSGLTELKRKGIPLEVAHNRKEECDGSTRSFQCSKAR